MIDLTVHAQGTVLAVHAQPGAKRNAVLGTRAGALRVAVTAPPEQGKANAAIGAVLAASLGCRSSQIALIAGETSRRKRFLVIGVTLDDLRRRLAAAIPDAGPTLPLS
jgi:uncharacterized protein (TIGR00251 family)